MDWPNTPQEYSLQTAEVKSVVIDETGGSRVVTANVLSYYDCAILPVRIDCPMHMQYIPVAGQLVLIMRTANNFVRIIAHFGEQLFVPPIKSGEVLVEGAGHGFVYLNNAGDATISDGYLSNVQRFFAGVGISITADGYSLNVKGVGQINITPEDSKLGNTNQIEILKTKGQVTTGKITMSDEKIELIKNDGKAEAGKVVLTKDKTMVYSSAVELGKDPDSPAGASDLKGGVIVGGVPGGYNFDMMTGAPIPYSKTVKASI